MDPLGDILVEGFKVIEDFLSSNEDWFPPGTKDRLHRIIEENGEENESPLEVIEDIKFLHYLSKLGEWLSLIHLKEIKDTEIYREAGYSWAKFCDKYGLKVKTVNRQLARFEIIDREFREVSLKMGYASFYRNIQKKLKEERDERSIIRTR